MDAETTNRWIDRYKVIIRVSVHAMRPTITHTHLSSIDISIDRSIVFHSFRWHRIIPAMVVHHTTWGLSAVVFGTEVKVQNNSNRLPTRRTLLSAIFGQQRSSSYSRYRGKTAAVSMGVPVAMRPKHFRLSETRIVRHSDLTALPKN